jgi:hypothetical protein
MFPEHCDECHGKEGASLCVLVIYMYAEVMCKLELLTGG